MSLLINSLMLRPNLIFSRTSTYLHQTGVISRCCSNSTKKPSDEATETAVKGPPKLSEINWQLEFKQKEKGKIAGKVPHKMTLQKGKIYKWCSCGHSKHQPFCDNSHRHPEFRTTLKPLTFKAPEDVVVWLCTCKQSNKRPFCDGTHRREDIQEAVRV